MADIIKVRADEATQVKWKQKASEDGIDLSKWIRNACNAYCVETEPTETPVKAKVKLAPIVEIDPGKPKGVKVEHEDIGGFKIPKDIVKSRAERLGLDKKPKGAAELFGHMLPQGE